MAEPMSRIARIRQSLSPSEWTRVGGMAAVIVGLNVAGWLMLAAAVGGHYKISSTEVFGFGTGILAYTLGMRHAFDADHIAAIDNTTRKLVQDGKRPLSVGFFFSLGHSTIVFVLALLLNFGIRALDSEVKNDSSGLHNATGIIGTTVSGTFLYLIALLNLVVLIGIVKVFREMRTGRYSDEELETPAGQPRADEPGVRRVRPADRHAVEDVPGRGAVRAGVRHRHRGHPAGPGGHRGGRPGCRSTRSCRCRSCSRPGCACSTPPTGAS